MRGDAKGGSFAFSALDDIRSIADGQPLREVIDMTVREISVAVVFPAYKSTKLSVRAGQRAEAPRGRSVAMAERVLRSG
jgi:phage head maturation protease